MPSIHWLNCQEAKSYICNNRRQYQLNWHFYHFYHGYEVVHTLHTIKRKKRLINLIFFPCIHRRHNFPCKSTKISDYCVLRSQFSQSHAVWIQQDNKTSDSIDVHFNVTLFVMWSACNSKLLIQFVSLWVKTFQLTWFSDSDKKHLGNSQNKVHHLFRHFPETDLAPIVF